MVHVEEGDQTERVVVDDDLDPDGPPEHTFSNSSEQLEELFEEGQQRGDDNLTRSPPVHFTGLALIQA